MNVNAEPAVPVAGVTVAFNTSGVTMSVVEMVVTLPSVFVAVATREYDPAAL